MATVLLSCLVVNNYTLQRVLVSTVGTVKMLMLQFDKYLMILSLITNLLSPPHFFMSFIPRFRQIEVINTVEVGKNNLIPPDHQN